MIFDVLRRASMAAFAVLVVLFAIVLAAIVGMLAAITGGA